MTVVGVDLGTRRVALVVPAHQLAFRADLEKAAGRRDYLTEADAGRALGAQCRTQLFHWFTAGLPVLGLEFYFERPVTGAGPRRNIRTAVGQGLSAGALLAQLPGSLYEVSNTQWKKELIGDGRAKPEVYRAWLSEHHPTLAALCGQDEDLAAASCIGVWAELASREQLS